MATGKGPRPDDLSLYGRLAASPEEHHVFQALRLLEAHFAEAPRLGESRRPREDRLRLGQEAELARPSTTAVQDVEMVVAVTETRLNR